MSNHSIKSVGVIGPMLDSRIFSHQKNWSEVNLTDWKFSPRKLRKYFHSNLELAKTVSCHGNILLNVGPTKNGIIEPIFVQLLRDLGKWLGNNGDAIYSSHPWKYQNDTKTPGIWYTSKVQSTDRLTVYAIVLDYPYDADGVILYSLGAAFDNNTQVTMLGFPRKLEVCCQDWIQNQVRVSTKSSSVWIVVWIKRIDVCRISTENSNR